MESTEDALGLERSQLRSRLFLALHWLTEPASTLNASEKRRSSLFAWLHLCIFLLTNAINLLLLIANPHHDPRRSEYGGLISGLIVLVPLSGAYCQV